MSTQERKVRYRVAGIFGISEKEMEALEVYRNRLVPAERHVSGIIEQALNEVVAILGPERAGLAVEYYIQYFQLIVKYLKQLTPERSKQALETMLRLRREARSNVGVI